MTFELLSSVNTISPPLKYDFFKKFKLLSLEYIKYANYLYIYLPCYTEINVSFENKHYVFIYKKFKTLNISDTILSN